MLRMENDIECPKCGKDILQVFCRTEGNKNFLSYRCDACGAHICLEDASRQLLKQMREAAGKTIKPKS